MATSFRPTRRATLRGALVVLPVVAGRAEAAVRRRPRFFSAAELGLVDVLSELIIPADEHAPGARAAEVAWEIDRNFADMDHNVYAPVIRLWREGLRRVDALARRQLGVPHFVRAPHDGQLAILTALASAEHAPATPEQKFFVALKLETARAYYSSELGLLQEFEYKGNVYLEEFVGTHPGQVPAAKPRT